MADESSLVRSFSFKLDPAGQNLTVFLKCMGISTGTYTVQFGLPGKSDQIRTGNIESPEKHQFPAESELTKVGVSVKSVPFLASDPGSYMVTVEQSGGNRLETPLMPYSAQVEVVIERPASPI